jgi:hypothetical protein
VQKALGEPDDKEVVGLLVVVGRQAPQQLGRARVVGARGDQAQAEDGALRHLGIGVVRELGQSIHDGHGGITNREEAERERDSSAHDGLAVLEQMVESAHCHRFTEILAHGDHGNAQHSDGLVAVVLLEVLAAHGQQALDLQHVGGTGVGACIDRKVGVSASLAFDGLQRGKCDVGLLLLGCRRSTGYVRSDQRHRCEGGRNAY